MSTSADRNRLRWRCRRGLLELDLLLARILDQEYPRLTASERAAFEVMLETPDPTLLGWLRGTEEPASEEIRKLIKKII